MLPIGATLGQFVIEGHLGAGGMGEVYRARDSRLGRSVALKLLPERLSHDGDRLARFAREAKVLASLNHPNIAALYGFEQHDRHHVLVMELVEGDTLAERIAKGRLGVGEALRISRDVLAGLQAAHEKGVIHRDLKPSNIKISPDAGAKVLDFGLAKGVDTGTSDPALTASPTISLAATRAGLLLGTAAYMSPEQARGHQVDHRSDVFSFGAVLYEMLTGRRLFEAGSTADVLAGVLTREPDFSALPPEVGPRIQQVLGRCLAKDAKDRWHTVADLRAELDVASDSRSASTVYVVTAPKPLWRRALPVVAATLAGAAVAAGAITYLTPEAPRVVSRSTYALPEGQNFTGGAYHLAAVAPDGNRFAYVANSRLFLKSVSELEAVPIPGTEVPQNVGLLEPVFSPDGRSIAFFSTADQTLKRIGVAGGTPVTIAPAEPPMGLSWGPDDQLVFGQPDGIWRAPSSGGTPERLIEIEAPQRAHGPHVLPGGDAVLFTLAAGSTADFWPTASIVVQSLKTGSRKTLAAGRDARYLSSGHVAFVQRNDLVVVPFDVAELQVTGEPTVVVQGIRVAAGPTASGAAQYTVSNSGSLAYVPPAGRGAGPGGPGGSTLARVSMAGQVTPLLLPPGAYDTPRVSPDGASLLYQTDDGKERLLWVYPLSGTTSPRRLTFGRLDRFPVWMDGGSRVAFSSSLEQTSGIWAQAADGSSPPVRLTRPEGAGAADAPNDFAPVAKVLSFTAIRRNATDNDLSLFSFAGNAVSPVVAVPASNQGDGVFSPDERWMAYASAESGRYEVYVQPYPATGAKFQVTRGGGHHPLWSHDGKMLYFVSGALPGPDVRAGSLGLFSVSVNAAPSFSTTEPRALPIRGFVQGATWAHQFDLTADGNEFIVLMRQGETGPPVPPAGPRIQVVLNWFEELKRLGRVPN